MFKGVEIGILSCSSRSSEIVNDEKKQKHSCTWFTPPPFLWAWTHCKLNCYLCSSLRMGWTKTPTSSHSFAFKLSCQGSWQSQWCYFIDSLAKIGCWKSTHQKLNAQKCAVLGSKNIKCTWSHIVWDVTVCINFSQTVN